MLRKGRRIRRVYSFYSIGSALIGTESRFNKGVEKSGERGNAWKMTADHDWGASEHEQTILSHINSK